MTSQDSPSRTQAVGLGSAARDLYRALWRHAQGVRLHLLGAAGLLSAAQLLRLTMPWLAAQAINALQQDDMTTAGRWIGYLVGIYLLSWLLHGPGRILERNVGVRVRVRLADQLYARIAAAPLAWRDGRHSGELQHRVVQSSRALSDFAQNQFGYLQSAFNFVGPLVALALLSRTSGTIAVTGYVVIAVIILRFDRVLMQLARAENDAERRYAAALLDFVGNAATVIGLRLQAASRKVLGKRIEAVMVPLRRTVTVNEGKWFAVDILGMGLTWILVVVYVLQSREPGQAVMLGTVFMIYQYAQQAATVVGAMASNFQSFARMHTDYGSAEPIWEAPGDPDAVVPAVIADAPWEALVLHNVSWHYADDARGGLRSVELTLRRGSRVALIGPSGGGKSTLLRTLAGLYLPQDGTLLRDGNAIDWPALRTLATLIPQEAEVFEASVEENLTFGASADPQALQAAVHAGVFDDPPAAPDPLAEARVFDRMYEAFPDACTVASVPRPSLLERFDTLVVMEGGRVVDAGPRDEVLARRT